MRLSKVKISVTAIIMCAIMLLCGISGARDVSASGQTYETMLNVKTAGSSLEIEPTLIFEPSTFDDISAAYTASTRPASIILTPDEDMNVTLGETTRSLASAYDSFIKGKFIPVISLTSSTVDAFISWMTNTYTITDMMAISSDIEVLEKLYADDVCYIVNTVYDLRDITISSDRYGTWEYLGAANAAGCNILMFDASDPNIGVAAEYISAMTKVCWGYAEDYVTAVDAISAGCYGIVSGYTATLEEAISVFSKDGYARAQYLAAHRGITAYANENSLTAIAAAENEGATHVEIDLQITADQEIVLCHNSQTNSTANKTGIYFSKVTLADLKKLTLEDYSNKYGESYASLREVMEYMRDTDMIFIFELKFDSASTYTVKELKAIQTLADIMADYPEMDGHWFVHTFYEPLAEGMREILPEIPVRFIGAAQSDYEKDTENGGDGMTWDGLYAASTSYAKHIAFLRKYNMVMSEQGASVDSVAQNYLARGYTQNTGTFTDLSNFTVKANIAVSDVIEECSMLVKEISNADLSMTEREYTEGYVTVPCTTYCGWVEQLECQIIEVSRTDNTASVMLYYVQQVDDDTSYGLYSRVVTIAIT